MTGEFEGCKFVGAASSNYYKGRLCDIARVVIHTTQGSFQSAVQWFLTQRSPGSSAHLITRKDGYTVQSVLEADTAFAAPTANADGLHLELEGDCYNPVGLFPPLQMEVAVRIVAYWCRKYEIPPDRAHILGHYQINPGYRDDPGVYFPWKEFVAAVAKACGAPPPPDLWMHPDGLAIHKEVTTKYGVRWPANAHHGYVTVDRKWQVWKGLAKEPDGKPAKPKWTFHDAGERHALLQVYDANFREIAADDLLIKVG